MTREEWRPVPSLPWLLASSRGRIMVAPYQGATRRYAGKPRWGEWDPVQKRFVIMFRGKTYRVGRLVCEAFHGPAPFEGARALHIDENSRNNRPSNLQWGTQKQNLNAPGFLAYCRRRTGKNSPIVKGRLKRQTS